MPGSAGLATTCISLSLLSKYITEGSEINFMVKFAVKISEN